MEPEAPGAEQGQIGADLVTPTVEEMPVSEPVAPAMEEPPATGPTSPGGEVHDEGDPADALSGEEAWTVAGSSRDPTEAETETARDAPSGTVEGPPVATEQAAPVTGMGLERPI